MNLLTLENVNITDRLTAFSAVVNYGERIHLIGANGAGKSTLLMAIAGEITFNGEIFFNQISIRKYKNSRLAKIQSFVVQQLDTLPFMPVFHYLSLFHRLSEMHHNVLNRLLNDFQLDKLLSKNIHHLSGGEWQRVRIAAAFIALWSKEDLTGKLMLLDEPTNNLDIVQRAILDKWLDKFCQQGGAIIMSTHDLFHSYMKADKNWLMSEGILVKSGTSTLLLNEELLSQVFNAKIKCVTDNERIDWPVFLS